MHKMPDGFHDIAVEQGLDTHAKSWEEVEMRLHWHHGAAHSEPHNTKASAHMIRVRLGAGFGSEAHDGEPLAKNSWRSGAMEYLPPECDYSHTTELETDWISVELSRAEWLELAQGRLTAPRIVKCRDDFRYEHNNTWIRTTCFQADTRAVATIEAQEALCLSIINAFRKAINQDSREVFSRSISEETFRRVAEFVDSKIQSRVSLSELAEEAGLSKFYFTSAFKMITGFTPYQYVVERRLMRARQLLQVSAESITSVALECGFANHAHLTSFFSRRVGVTPFVYRNSCSKRTLVFDLGCINRANGLKKAG